MNILVTGSEGMLGTEACSKALQSGHKVVATTHRDLPIENRSAVKEVLRAQGVQVVINCAGKTSGPVESMMISNAVGPHVLAEECLRLGIRTIHISTDCVFSGTPEEDAPARRYRVETRPDPTTPYGRSKLAGEPMLPNTLVIRTSFVGLTSGLGAWLLENKGKEIDGWASAYWNGTSLPMLALVLIEEATRGDRSGLHHAASAEKVSKCWLLELLSDILGLEVKVKPVTEPWIDRALMPTIDLPPLREALKLLNE